MRATIRPYEHGDLSSILHLWERTSSSSSENDGLGLDQAVELMTSDTALTLVADREGEIVGMVIGEAAAAVGWIYRLSVSSDAEGTEISGRCWTHSSSS